MKRYNNVYVCEQRSDSYLVNIPWVKRYVIYIITPFLI